MMGLANSIAKFAKEASGLQKVVGFTVASLALIFSLFNMSILWRVHGIGIAKALFNGYIAAIYLIGVVALTSAICR